MWPTKPPAALELAMMSAQMAGILQAETQQDVITLKAIRKTLQQSMSNLTVNHNCATHCLVWRITPNGD